MYRKKIIGYAHDNKTDKGLHKVNLLLKCDLRKLLLCTTLNRTNSVKTYFCKIPQMFCKILRVFFFAFIMLPSVSVKLYRVLQLVVNECNKDHQIKVHLATSVSPSTEHYFHLAKYMFKFFFFKVLHCEAP